jgi:hypothetical protein
MPRKNVVNVKPTSDADVARSALTRGNAGVYMSVANGGTALCNANVKISAVLTVAAPPATPPVGGLVETGTDESPRTVIATPLRT